MAGSVAHRLCLSPQSAACRCGDSLPGTHSRRNPARRRRLRSTPQPRRAGCVPKADPSRRRTKSETNEARRAVPRTARRRAPRVCALSERVPRMHVYRRRSSRCHSSDRSDHLVPASRVTTDKIMQRPRQFDVSTEAERIGFRVVELWLGNESVWAWHRGGESAVIWTCDLSHDYVSINADYRS